MTEDNNKNRKHGPPDQVHKAVSDWREADLLARAVESRMLELWDAHVSNATSMLPSDLIEDVTRARAHANDRLTVAIGLMDLERRR